MILRATSAGLRAARANLPLVASLWLVNLSLALAFALPFSLALRQAAGPLPEADGFAERFSLGVVADLAELRPGLVSGMGHAALAAFALGLLVALVAAGGALEVLVSGDERPFAHRFGRGGFRFFGRFLRLGSLVLPAAVLLTAFAAGPLVALGRHLRHVSGSEWLTLSVELGAFLAGSLVLLLVLLLQDAARVRIVREDLPRVLPPLRQSLPLVLGHPSKWLGAWACNGLLLLAAFAAYVAIAGQLSRPALLAALVLAQQLFVLARCGLRVALLGAEVALVSELRPLAALTAGGGGAPLPPVAEASSTGEPRGSVAGEPSAA
jgi:hypothetical protein